MTIRSLGYIVVESTDPAQWDTFLVDSIGVMRGEAREDGAQLYRVDDRPFRIWVQPGDTDRLLAAAYELSADSFDAVMERIRAAERSVEMATKDEAAARGVDRLARTSDPAGNGLEFYVGDTRTDEPFRSPQGIDHFVTGEMGMGHVVLATPDFAAAHAFYQDVVGFHDTDTPRFKMGPDDEHGMGFAFMHADNGRHHSVALAEMPVPPSRCIHIMFEVPDMDEVGTTYDRVRRAGYKLSATLGKHMNDKMTSFYVQTPGGFDLEFGCDGLVIDPDTWKTTAHEQISIWGHEWAWQQAAATEAAR